VHHLDVVGLMAQEDEGGLDVEVLPSRNNIDLALSIAGLSISLALDYFDQSLGAVHAEAIKGGFDEFKKALDAAQGAAIRP
jgi:hypothetical protein